MLRIAWVMVRSADILLQVNSLAQNTIKHTGRNTPHTHTCAHTNAHIFLTLQGFSLVFDK